MVKSVVDDDVNTLTLRKYISEIKKHRLLTIEEEVLYGKQAQQGDLTAFTKLIEGSLRLVVWLANKKKHLGVPVLDLVQEGNLGLIDAVKEFDPERGRFASIATYYINEKMSSAIDCNDMTKTAYMVRKERKYKKVVDIEKYDDKEASVLEIAEHLGVKKIETLRTLVYFIQASEVSFFEETPEVPADKNTEPDFYYETYFFEKALNKVLCLLSSENRVFLCRRYGLGWYEKETFIELTRTYKVTTEALRQRNNRLLSRIRAHLADFGHTFTDLIGE
jgi:RNA polymerase nonessential primary-like sigma factor